MRRTFSNLAFSAALMAFPTISFGQAAAPNLGAAANMAIYTPAGAIGNTGLTLVTGDMGTVNGAVTGFLPGGTGVYTGTLHQGDAVSQQADSDVQAAFGSLAGNSADSILNYSVGLGSKQVLKPYVYYVGGATLLDDTLFLDAQGDPAALFIFQINGVLNTSALSRIVLLDSARLSNVYWQVNGATNMGANSIFMGTLISNGAISMGNGATLLGHGLSTFAAINLDSNTVTLATTSTPLPIGLISFSATKQGSGVRLKWSTATEQDISDFVIERSANAQPGTWAAVGTPTAAANNSASVREYSLTDYHAARGANYYRLRINNTNGTYSLSQVAVLYSDDGPVSIGIFPNPASGSITITGAAAGNTIMLMDMTGKVWRQAPATADGIVRIATDRLHPGTYILKVMDAGARVTAIQVIKQ